MFRSDDEMRGNQLPRGCEVHHLHDRIPAGTPECAHIARNCGFRLPREPAPTCRDTNRVPRKRLRTTRDSAPSAITPWVHDYPSRGISHEIVEKSASIVREKHFALFRRFGVAADTVGLFDAHAEGSRRAFADRADLFAHATFGDVHQQVHATKTYEQERIQQLHALDGIWVVRNRRMSHRRGQSPSRATDSEKPFRRGRTRGASS